MPLTTLNHLTSPSRNPHLTLEQQRFSLLTPFHPQHLRIEIPPPSGHRQPPPLWRAFPSIAIVPTGVGGASSPRVVACVVVALLLLSFAVEPLEAVAAAAAPATATKPIRCRKCDHACKKSCKGYGRNSDCSVPCGDPSNKAGCKSCLQAYYSKCLNYCGQACRAVCIN
ncbi:uncharacterized protein LOC127766386 [Oryza glaberrima]|uniref:uncharacterized protein LOC127766386 n=1 Tax=Oryza glaberrima TaxID=4538 RepID=UPI00224C18B5|nr:uncharacterized protein LOC127766386 [Oryza glaberrima]